jgi:hypothetical protein
MSAQTKFVCSNQKCSLIRKMSIVHASYTDKKENQIFLIYKEIQNGAVAKSYMTNGLLIQYIGKYLRISSYILGSPASYLTLQLLHSEFPYI